MNKFIKKNKFLLIYTIAVLTIIVGLVSTFSNSFNELFDSYNLITLDVTVKELEVDTNYAMLTFEEYPDCDYILSEDNYFVVSANGFNEKVKVGSKVVIRTFPMYTESFTLIPIVSITVDDEILLDEEIGYENFLKMFEY